MHRVFCWQQFCQACNNNVGKQPPLGHWVSWGDSGLGTFTPNSWLFCFDQGCLGNDTYYILLFNDSCIITNIHTIDRYWPSDVEMGMGQSRGPQSKGAYPVMDASPAIEPGGKHVHVQSFANKSGWNMGIPQCQVCQIEGVNGSWVLPRSPCSGGACEVEFGVFPNAWDMAKQLVKWYTLASGKHR
jgi:hypothetical protein